MFVCRLAHTFNIHTMICQNVNSFLIHILNLVMNMVNILPDTAEVAHLKRFNAVARIRKTCNPRVEKSSHIPIG